MLLFPNHSLLLPHNLELPPTNLLLSSHATASMNFSVFTYSSFFTLSKSHKTQSCLTSSHQSSSSFLWFKSYLGPWIKRARSLVIFPDSTVSIQAASSFSVKFNSAALLSSFALVRSHTKPDIQIQPLWYGLCVQLIHYNATSNAKSHYKQSMIL